MTKKAQFSVRTDDRIRDALEKAAKEEHRSLASVTNDALEYWLKAKGYLKD